MIEPWIDHDEGVLITPTIDGGFTYTPLKDRSRVKMVILKLTPREAKTLWDTVDGQSDAGACRGGNTSEEQEDMREIMNKLLPFMRARNKARA